MIILIINFLYLALLSNTRQTIIDGIMDNCLLRYIQNESLFHCPDEESDAPHLKVYLNSACAHILS